MKKLKVKGSFWQEKRDLSIEEPLITIIDKKIVKVPNEFIAQNL